MAQYIYDNFDAVDTDHDGTISFAEAQAAQPRLTTEDFAELDADSDGMLTKEELETYLGLSQCCFNCSGGGLSAGAVAGIIAFVVAVFGLIFFMIGS
jgi:Ca2+-binding EF-hand superfamily protein